MAGMSPGLSGLGSAAGFAAAGPGGAMAGSAVGMTADYLIASYERRKQERQLKKEIARREREAKRLEAKADANMSYDRMRQRGADERTIAAEAFNMEMAKVSARNVQQDRLRQSMSQAKQSSQQQQDQFANRGYL